MRVETKVLVGVTTLALLGCSGLGFDLQTLEDLSAIEEAASMYDAETVNDAKDQLEGALLDGKVTGEEIARFREEVERAASDGQIDEQDEEALAIFADRLLEE